MFERIPWQAMGHPSLRIVRGMILILGTTVTTACYQPPSEPIEQSEVPGQYVAEGVNEKDILGLTQDGLFTQQCVTQDGDTIVNSGAWEFSQSQVKGRYKLILSDYRPLNPQWINDLPFFSDEPAASVGMLIDKRRGRIRIWLNRDIPCSYVKVK